MAPVQGLSPEGQGLLNHPDERRFLADRPPGLAAGNVRAVPRLGMGTVTKRRVTMRAALQCFVVLGVGLSCAVWSAVVGEAAADAVLVDGNMSSLNILGDTGYLDGDPAILFTGVQPGFQVQQLSHADRLVLVDGTWQDLAIELCGVAMAGRREVLVPVLREGIYEVYAPMVEIGEYIPRFDLRIGGEIVKFEGKKIRRLLWKGWGSNGRRRYAKTHELRVNPGEHRFGVARRYAGTQSDEKDIRVILVRQDERKRMEKEVWMSINELRGQVAHLFSTSGDFHVRRSADYVIRAKIKPRLFRPKVTGAVLTPGNEKELVHWSFSASNVTYKYVADADDILVVTSYFDGNAQEDEYVRLSAEGLYIDLEQYPIVSMRYGVEDPQVQTIEIVLGLDLDGDNVVDEHLKGIYPKRGSGPFETFTYKAYKKAQSLYPNRPVYRVVKVELYPHKLWETDCSDPEREGDYMSWIAALSFYRYGEPKPVGSRRRALDVNTGEEDRGKWTAKRTSNDPQGSHLLRLRLRFRSSTLLNTTRRGVETLCALRAPACGLGAAGSSSAPFAARARRPCDRASVRAGAR